MFLKYRPAKVQDLNECFLCLRDRFAYDERAKRALLAFWTEGLHSGTLHMMLMEDLDALPGARIFYYAFKAYLQEDYAQCLRDGGAPLVGRHVLDLWRGGSSPLLALDQIRAVNSGRVGRGLHMITLHSGAPGFITGENYAFMTTKSVDWGGFSASGFRLREYFMELYGEREWAWPEGAGFLLRHEYEAGVINGVLVPLDKRPRLYGITADEVRVSTTPALMFYWQPPRFFFTPAQQELLLHGISGDPDEDLADDLSLALVSVKKRWESIYKRVETAAPEFFEASGADGSGRRGGEKKRRLLAYLRHHMEELRPLPPSG